MADAKENKTQGDHDRVTMLSLRADGTPDQTNPEIIGDKETAIEATAEQFRQLDVEGDADAKAKALVNKLHQG